MLLLTPYFAVQKGQDRSDLLTMLKHAAQIFQNVPAVRNSLALVVTKVEAYKDMGNEEWAPVPVDEVQAGVAGFLREDVLPFLNTQASTGSRSERDIYRRAADIVNVLLTKENGWVSAPGPECRCAAA